MHINSHIWTWIKKFYPIDIVYMHKGQYSRSNCLTNIINKHCQIGSTHEQICLIKHNHVCSNTSNIKLGVHIKFIWSNTFVQIFDQTIWPWVTYLRAGTHGPIFDQICLTNMFGQTNLIMCTPSLTLCLNKHDCVWPKKLILFVLEQTNLIICTAYLMFAQIHTRTPTHPTPLMEKIYNAWKFLTSHNCGNIFMIGGFLSSWLSG